MTYDEACRRLHTNLCSKLSDYKTECNGCPMSTTCYMEIKKGNSTERTEKFENAIITKVKELGI